MQDVCDRDVPDGQRMSGACKVGGHRDISMTDHGRGQGNGREAGMTFNFSPM